MKTTLSTLVLCSLAFSPLFAQNLLVNPGFEDPITSDGPPFVGSWEGFQGSGASAANTSAMPQTGAQSLGLTISATDNTFAGAFQDVEGLVAGTDYIFSGWHATPSDPFDVGVEIRIEWRNSGSNSEISRTPNMTPIPTASYSPFSLSAQVPVGADTARVVYAIQSFGQEPSNNGIAYVDDVSFAAVPEPSAIALLGIGSLGLLMVRRRMA